MSSYNIGPKIGIEGEAQFRAQIRRINQEYKAMADYTKTVSKTMEQQGRSQELLEAKSNSLRQQLGLQEQKLKELNDALAKAKALYGDNSQEVLRFEGAILDVKNTTTALERELSDTEKAMQDLVEGIVDVGDAADASDDKVSTFGDMLKAGIASGVILNTLEQVGDVIVEIGGQAIEATAEVKAANAQFSQTFANLEGTATSALRAISDETGIAVTRLQGGYTALYAFTKSVGGDSDTALSIAERALTAAADSAAYYDRTLEGTIETLKSFIKGNYENDAALGIAATETTRNAKANELYAKSFKELNEAQKVDVLLAMVEAGNEASGALGQAAREADAWTNVQGEFNEALRQTMAWLGGPVLKGITPLIQGITEGLRDLVNMNAWESLRAGTVAFRDSLEESDATLAANNTKIETSAVLAGRYLDRLEELAAQGLATDDAMREYAATVDLLNTLMPELNLTIDEGTGLLDQNTAQIRTNIDALREHARQMAYQEYYTSILDAVAAIEKKRYDAELRMYELQHKINAMVEAGVKDVDMYAAAEAVATGKTDAFWKSLSTEQRELYYLKAELAAVEGSLGQYNTEMAQQEQRLNAVNAAMAETTAKTESVTAATEEQTTAQAELADAYKTAKASARESIDSQIGLFDKLSDESRMSAAEIVENWDNQKKAFSGYSDNLKKAVDMGLDKALVQQLSDGSQQSILILDELVNGSKISVDEINTAFRGLNSSKNTLSGTMADIQDIVIDSLEDTAADAKAAGKDIVDGAIRGIKANISRFADVMSDLAKGGQSAYNHTWERHSPSRWMRDASDDIADGGILQIKRRISDMRRAMADLATAGQDGYLQEQLNYAAAFPSRVATGGGYGGAVANNTTNNYSRGDISIVINTQPGQDVNAIAAAVSDRLKLEMDQEVNGIGGFYI